MILSKSRKFIFLRVPKTASTSLQRQILESIPDKELDIYTQIETYNQFGDEFSSDCVLLHKKFPHTPIPLIFNAKNSHPTLQDLIVNGIISYSEIHQYNVYGVIRNPVDRIISLAQHILTDMQIYSAMNNNDAVEEFFKVIDREKHFMQEIHKAVFYPQIHWLRYNGRRINKIFRYEDVCLLLHDVLGNIEMKYSHRSKIRKCKNTDLAQELVLECRDRYAEDFVLWESLQTLQLQS